jgi:hypothetical protein
MPPTTCKNGFYGEKRVISQGKMDVPKDNGNNAESF